MNNDEVEDRLNRLQTPKPEKVMQPRELKIPLLSYRKSSKAGLWLLILPLTVALTVFFKMELGVQWSYLDLVRRFFSGIDKNAMLTYLIPLIFFGLPFVAMVINLLAICHFHQDRKAKELIVTIKFRPVNIAVFLLSVAVLIFFLLPDKLSF